MSTYDVAVLVGSLRKGSFTRKAAQSDERHVGLAHLVRVVGKALVAGILRPDPPDGFLVQEARDKMVDSARNPA